MISVDFQLDKVILRKATSGGVISLAIEYKKFPALANMPMDELEHLGAALGLGLANLDFQEAKIGLKASLELAESLDGPKLAIPSQELVLP